MSHAPIHQPKPVHIEVKPLLYSFLRLNHWSYENLSAPYWRLYWNAGNGAWVGYAETKIELHPGQVLLIPPDTAFSCGLIRPVEFLYIHFTVYSPGIFFQPNIHILERTSGLPQQARSLASRIEKGEMGLGLESGVYTLTASALEAVSEKSRQVRKQDPQLEKVIRHIDENAFNLIQNNQLARMCGMSISGFIRHFRKAVGVSPKAYALQKRIERACTLLHSSKLSMDEIAEQCGFWDRNYFTRMFIKYRNTPPGAYRKNFNV